MVEENNKLIHKYLNKGPLVPDYSKHWNLIMEIIKHLTDSGISVEIKKFSCVIRKGDRSYETISSSIKESIYTSIVNFIKSENLYN